MSVKKNLRLDVACRFMAASCVLTAVVLTGCSEDGTRTVTVGDNEPVLELPEKLKNANPNVRRLMKPDISSRIAGTDDWQYEPVFLETATSVDEDNVDAADAVKLPEEVLESGNYDVRVEWTYPQQQADDHVDLGTTVYEIRSDDGNPPEPGITAIGAKDTNPLDLDNIQLLNSLYKGDDNETIELSSVGSLLHVNNDQAIPEASLVDFSGPNVYIADYTDDLEYGPMEEIGTRWGVNDPLVIVAVVEDDKVVEDFENVQFSAIGSNEAMYFQLTNLNPDGSPFEYQVEVAINRPAESQPSPVEFSDNQLVISENSTIDNFESDDMYAYRLNSQSGRLDYRQNRIAGQPLKNDISIAFYEDNEGNPQKVAEWSGVVLFGTKTQVEQNLVLTVSGQNGETNSNTTFKECTPLIIAAELKGVDDPLSVNYSFSHDYDGLSPTEFIQGDAPNFDHSVPDKKNFRLPPLPANQEYTFTVEVKAWEAGQSDADAKTESKVFTVTDDASVTNGCS